MKIISFYLPQFHTFPENDKWWGKGFTEWTNLRNALPVYKGHKQPKIPYQNQYYNLLDISTLKEQAEQARKYGIYGFCYYHYWFDGRMLMQKPMEMLLEHKEIPLHYCISWANEDWTRAWGAKDRTILMKQTYGKEESWKRHFEYLLPFFQDERYIKIENQPLFILYRPELIPVLGEMLQCFQRLAIENGLDGIKFAYQKESYHHLHDKNGSLFDYGIEYQPNYVRVRQEKNPLVIAKKCFNELIHGLNLPSRFYLPVYFDYDNTWRRILRMKIRDEKMLPGAFVDWDNTPRYKRRAVVTKGFTCEKFERYLTLQIRRAKEVYQKDFLFLFAWNEWGEGGYLEPDEEDAYGRLEAVRRALIRAEEWEEDT